MAQSVIHEDAIVGRIYRMSSTARETWMVDSHRSMGAGAWSEWWSRLQPLRSQGGFPAGVGCDGIAMETNAETLRARRMQNASGRANSRGVPAGRRTYGRNSRGACKDPCADHQAGVCCIKSH